MTGSLLVRPNTTSSGCVTKITPDSADWTYVGFEVHAVQAGATLEGYAEDRETCVVIVQGTLELSVEGNSLGAVGGRQSPFTGNPYSAYVPAGSPWALRAAAQSEVAICTAPGSNRLPPRIIPPDEVVYETRGTGTNTRYVRNILPETSAADSLLVVEVITPGGHWSSYPPHKHDVDALPDESLLEETYYHRLARPEGFAIQHVYTDDRLLDQTMTIGDRDVVLVPRGYHPVGAAHGYDLYYLNVMAGPKRTWRITTDPNHAWLMR